MDLNYIGKKKVRYWLMRIANNNHDLECDWLKKLFDGELNNLQLSWEEFSIKLDVDFNELTRIVII